MKTRHAGSPTMFSRSLEAFDHLPGALAAALALTLHSATPLQAGPSADQLLLLSLKGDVSIERTHVK